MSHRVEFSPEAQDDLDELFFWLADAASLEVARRYTTRIHVYCEALTTFPNRGSLRDDIRPGLRLVGFEKRVLIAFYVGDTAVTIMRVLYGGRDIEEHLR